MLAHTPMPPRCVIARYANTSRRARSSWRTTRITLAGSSVISSQNPRNVATSRAASNPTSARQNTPLSPATTRGWRTSRSASRA